MEPAVSLILDEDQSSPDTNSLAKNQSFGRHGTNPRITSQPSSILHSCSSMKTDLKIAYRIIFKH
jgi:hypothetical protein